MRLISRSKSTFPSSFKASRHKSAFTLLELILVFFILALIFSFASFSLKPVNKLELGAKQILRDLAYTRALALMQASFRSHESLVASKDEWFKARWQLYFINSAATNDEQTYTIFLDKNGDGNANIGKKNANIDREIAVDFIDSSKLMNSGQSGVIDEKDARANARFNIERNFGIEDVALFKACAGKSGKVTRVVFDELGRLYAPLKDAHAAYEKILYKQDNECIIRLQSAADSLCLRVDTLSGKASLVPFTNAKQLIFYKNKFETCENLR